MYDDNEVSGTQDPNNWWPGGLNLRMQYCIPSLPGHFNVGHCPIFTILANIGLDLRLKDPTPLVFLTVIVHKIILFKV